MKKSYLKITFTSSRLCDLSDISFILKNKHILTAKEWQRFAMRSLQIDQLHGALFHFYTLYPEAFSAKISKMLNFLFIVRKLRFYRSPENFSSLEKKYMSFLKSNMAANYYFLVNNTKMTFIDGYLTLEIRTEYNLKNLLGDDKCF